MFIFCIIVNFHLIYVADWIRLVHIIELEFLLPDGRFMTVVVTVCVRSGMSIAVTYIFHCLEQMFVLINFCLCIITENYNLHL